VRLNWTDRIIQPFAPRLALRRAVARSYLDQRDYDGAALGRRTSGRRAPSTSADSEIARALPRLRDRMRDLGLMELAVREMIESGEVIIRRRRASRRWARGPASTPDNGGRPA
jgi:capsid protein